MRIYFVNALAYTYVVGTAKITSDEIYTVTLGSAWDSNVQWDYRDPNFLSTENWITATATTHYLTVLDPDNDPNDDINGHIKLLSVGPMMFAYAVRVTFTKDINYWTEDNAGYYDIADNKGTIVETVDTEAGLYVFKQNPGAIYLLQGEPGPEATPGSLQLKFIHGGLTAVAGTIQATMGGVYFSTFEQDKIKTYFLPLTSNEVTEIPKLGEHYNPDIANIGNPAYTFT
jgi:hypothetical protein